jgi:GR25 family glycosyltransferase involved in LPS biosynthesis
MSSSDKIPIFVLKSQHGIRSSSLRNWLDGNSKEIDVKYFEPVIPNTKVEHLANSLASKHYGANLSLGEVGCALAHHQMYKIAVALDCPVWFVEDDALVVDLVPEDLRKLRNHFTVDNPVGISLYSRNFPIESVKKITLQEEGLDLAVFRRGLYPPFTVFYGLNQNALRVASNPSSVQIPIGKADFPSWGSGVRWFLLTCRKIDHSLELTTISERNPHPFGRGWSAALLLVWSRIRSFMNLLGKEKLASLLLWEFSELFFRACRFFLSKPENPMEHWK